MRTFISPSIRWQELLLRNHIFYRSLRIVAGDLNCVFIPVDAYWAGYLEDHRLRSADLVGADERYPNERGHQVIAEAMMKWLEHIKEGRP